MYQISGPAAGLASSKDWIQKLITNRGAIMCRFIPEQNDRGTLNCALCCNKGFYVMLLLVMTCRTSQLTTGWTTSLPQRTDPRLWLVASCTDPWTWSRWREKRWDGWTISTDICLWESDINFYLLAQLAPVRWTSCWWHNLSLAAGCTLTQR